MDGECYGGLGRVRTKVNEIRDDPYYQNVMLLNAGDFYQGTIWYSTFKYPVMSQFGNLMGYNASTLGNHEFDDSIEGVNFSVLSGF